MRLLSFTRYFVAVLSAFILVVLLLRLIGASYYATKRHPHPTFLDESVSSLNNTSNNNSSLTVNLVLASQLKDDIAWTENLRIPNLSVIRYLANDAHAYYRPPAQKGNEALIYLTYLYDFYDHLPDVAIFSHAEELPWHVEGTLLRNMSFALSQLDIDQVNERGYFNLRATWRGGCPDWIDTTKTHWNKGKEEEPFMRQAWAANFDGEAAPHKIGGPCCSQFAVTREFVHKQTREQYKKSMDWIVASKWNDRILGRVWEHMWPRLFTGKPSDCGHKERMSLCEMYGICFSSDKELRAYKELWEEIERLKTQMSFFWAVWTPGKAKAASKKMPSIVTQIEKELSAAWLNGRDAV